MTIGCATVLALLVVFIIPLATSSAHIGTEKINQRLEVLERKDAEKSMLIEHLTKMVLEQNEKIQVLKETAEDLAKQSSKLRRKEQILLKVDRNQAKLNAEIKTLRNILKQNRQTESFSVESTRTSPVQTTNMKTSHLQRTNQKISHVQKTNQKTSHVETTNQKTGHVQTTNQKTSHVQTINQKTSRVQTTNQETSHVQTTNQEIPVKTTNQTSKTYIDLPKSLDNSLRKNMKQTAPKHDRALKNKYGENTHANEDIDISSMIELLPGYMKNIRKCSSLHKLRTKSKRFVLNAEGPVAFHAVIDKALVDNLGTNENIKFDVILLNLGNGYHSQHGLFIAPKSGLYLFSTSILSYVGTKSEFQADLTKNGAVLARIFGHGDSGREDQGSVTVVTQMNAGDEVWVRHSSPANGAIYGGGFTSFTGILLFET